MPILAIIYDLTKSYLVYGTETYEKFLAINKSVIDSSLYVATSLYDKVLSQQNYYFRYIALPLLDAKFACTCYPDAIVMP